MRGFSVKKFLPRGLMGRSLLILITPVLLIQLITSFMFFDRHWTKVTTHLAFAVAGEIAVITSALKDGADTDKVQRIIRYTGDYLELHVAFETRGQLPAQKESSLVQVWEFVVAKKLERELSSMIDDPFVVHSNFANKWLEVFVEIPGGVIKVGFPQRRLFSSSAYIFLLWVLGTSLLLLIVAVLFMRNQVRPIRKLGVAMDRFGKGRDTPFFKPEGAIEVRQAGTAYLDMRRRIERQISQRTDMLAGVSHDLRTPLTRMKLQVEMMPEGEDRRAMADDIRAMEEMIHGYLDFVRGDGDEESVSLVLKDMLDKLSVQLGKQADVVVHMDLSGEEVLHVRPMAFERALMNLLVNAAHYADAIWVKAYRDGEKLHIQVEDDGPGVPPDQYEEVFKPFKRVDVSRNANTGGVGLGLAITMDIVHAHGGKIWLGESAYGGLCVTMRMPL